MPPGQLSRKNLTVSGHGANNSCNTTTVGGVAGKSNSHMVGGGQTSQRGSAVNSANKQGLSNGIIGKRHDSMTLTNALTNDHASYQ